MIPTFCMPWNGRGKWYYAGGNCTLGLPQAGHTKALPRAKGRPEDLMFLPNRLQAFHPIPCSSVLGFIGIPHNRSCSQIFLTKIIEYRDLTVLLLGGGCYTPLAAKTRTAAAFGGGIPPLEHSSYFNEKLNNASRIFRMFIRPSIQITVGNIIRKDFRNDSTNMFRTITWINIRVNIRKPIRTIIQTNVRKREYSNDYSNEHSN